MRVHHCHHALPCGPRWSRPLGAPPYSSHSPAIRCTIETFPKRAIYLFPINRSVVIKKSIWPRWASLAARERRFCARPQDCRGRQDCGGPQKGVPGRPHPRTGYLGSPAQAGRIPSSCKPRAPVRLASAPSFFSPAGSRAGAASGRRAAPRLLLLLGWLNRDFVKRDR